MRKFVVAAVVASLSVAPAFAQNQPAQSGPQNAAIKPVDQNNASAPVAGANSFTQSEAASRIQAKGYSNITGLKKDSNGVWRGMAMKNGQSVSVSVDYQGNVN